MTQTDPKLVAEIDSLDDVITERDGTDLVDGGTVDGGLEPTGGPYKPTDDPAVDPLLKPMGGPYKPTGDPETNGGPYKPTTDEPAAATRTN
ncbi:MAG: hypothetical protein HOV68_13905 [Streptomycetaceae bacterium]|nr:hypothetical protein [Streptomycetaceae bacterium]